MGSCCKHMPTRVYLHSHTPNSHTPEMSLQSSSHQVSLPHSLQAAPHSVIPKGLSPGLIHLKPPLSRVSWNLLLMSCFPRCPKAFP